MVNNYEIILLRKGVRSSSDSSIPRSLFFIAWASRYRHYIPSKRR